MTTHELVGELTYRNYEFNRKRSPEVTPEQWRSVYGGAVDLLERRYRANTTPLTDDQQRAHQRDMQDAAGCRGDR